MSWEVNYQGKKKKKSWLENLGPTVYFMKSPCRRACFSHVGPIDYVEHEETPQPGVFLGQLITGSTARRVVQFAFSNEDRIA